MDWVKAVEYGWVKARGEYGLGVREAVWLIKRAYGLGLKRE